MYATDFIYDGDYLSDFHFVICSIDSVSGVTDISSGSEITFNQTPLNYGKKYSLTSTQYNTCVSTTFDICKDPDYFEDIEITESEHRKIIRWLNRKDYHKFCFRTHYSRTCFYDASFNIHNLYIDDVLYGFRLTMQTNRPFGYGNEDTTIIDALSITKESTFSVYNTSDEIDYLYPNIKIEFLNNTDELSIVNESYLPDEAMIISNCVAGETIYIDCENQIIESTLSHNIANDFNFKFLRLGNSYNTGENEISISSPCKVTITYKPIIKNIN